MSNKTQLQTNNSTLDGYIARINAAKETAAGLPGAGSGGGASVEMCTVTIDMEGPGFDDFIVYSTNSNLEVITTTIDAMSGGTFQAAKGTLALVLHWHTIGRDSCQIFAARDSTLKSVGGVFLITEDCTIIFRG